MSRVWLHTGCNVQARAYSNLGFCASALVLYVSFHIGCHIQVRRVPNHHVPKLHRARNTDAIRLEHVWGGGLVVFFLFSAIGQLRCDGPLSAYASLVWLVCLQNTHVSELGFALVMLA